MTLIILDKENGLLFARRSESDLKAISRKMTQATINIISSVAAEKHTASLGAILEKANNAIQQRLIRISGEGRNSFANYLGSEINRSQLESPAKSGLEIKKKLEPGFKEANREKLALIESFRQDFQTHASDFIIACLVERPLNTKEFID